MRAIVRGIWKGIGGRVGLEESGREEGSRKEGAVEMRGRASGRGLAELWESGGMVVRAGVFRCVSWEFRDVGYGGEKTSPTQMRL